MGLLTRPSLEQSEILVFCKRGTGQETHPTTERSHLPQPADDRPLRTGFTTGACATAAAKGALVALVEQRSVDRVAIRLPRGETVEFVLCSCTWSETSATASVIKDAGDDPDVTHGAEIGCTVLWSETPGIAFRAGPGVGVVTKPGLPVPPGEPAINPVPRRMIRETLAEVLAAAGLCHRGVTVEIAVPGGDEMAKKTFNPRLGIVGGISILGTTGIVVPYSTSAWVASVLQAIDVAVAQDCRHLVLAVGNRGEQAARRLWMLPDVAYIQVGPFFGDALRHCSLQPLERVSLVSMIGKLAKFAAGNDSVHSTVSTQDFAYLAGIARAVGCGDETCVQIASANTAQEVSGLVEHACRDSFFSRLCTDAYEFGLGRLGPKIRFDVHLVGIDGDLLGRANPFWHRTRR
jgi:cobalt-precorrin-5B (C1)-methyltransferase